MNDATNAGLVAKHRELQQRIDALKAEQQAVAQELVLRCPIKVGADTLDSQGKPMRVTHVVFRDGLGINTAAYFSFHGRKLTKAGLPHATARAYGASIPVVTQE